MERKEDGTRTDAQKVQRGMRKQAAHTAPKTRSVASTLAPPRPTHSFHALRERLNAYVGLFMRQGVLIVSCGQAQSVLRRRRRCCGNHAGGLG